MKSCLVALAFLLLVCPLVAAAGVVINEVCYDPVGADFGKEWLELYNAGDEAIEITGAKIYSGGSSLTLAYTFPFFILRPGRFVLIGGDEVPNCHLTHNFRFQNGGGATDGIRFETADASYTDTVLYDSPNINALPDDSGLPGVSFAPKVPAGYSLARRADGFDSDDCAYDFRAEPNPSPGVSNPRYVDYGISGAIFAPESALLSFWLVNYSSFAPNDYARLIVNDPNPIYSIEIEPIAALDSLYIELPLSGDVLAIYIEIDLENDPNPANNSITIYAEGQALESALINEVFPAPLSGKQEWVELYLAVAPLKGGEYTLFDAAGNLCRFDLPAFPGYYVVCPDPVALAVEYPECPPEKILPARGWASLNNDGDELYLYLDEELVDSMSYVGAQLQKAKSLERHLNSEGQVIWRLSLHPAGASPGQPNPSFHLEPQKGKLKVSGSPFDPKSGEELCISYDLDSEDNRLRLEIFDLKGYSVRKLAENSFIPGRGQVIWDGKKSDGTYAPRGLYIILWQSQSASGGRIYEKQLSGVIK